MQHELASIILVSGLVIFNTALHVTRGKCFALTTPLQQYTRINLVLSEVVFGLGTVNPDWFAFLTVGGTDAPSGPELR